MRVPTSYSRLSSRRLSTSVLVASAVSFGLGFGCAGQGTSSAHAAAPTTAAAGASKTPTVTPIPASSAPDPELQRLAGSILVGGHAFEYLRDLSEGYGPRLTGSPVLAGAARWTVEAFKKAGIENAKIEEFTIPHGWERREARARIVGQAERSLHVMAVGWSVPTPPGGVRGQVLPVTDIEETSRLRPEELRGKILFMQRRPSEKGRTTPGDKDKRLIFARAVASFHKAGVAAIVLQQRLPNHVFAAHTGPQSGDLTTPFPFLDMSSEDAALLTRALEKGPVNLELVNTSPLLGPVAVPNVLAEIRGSTLPDEIVVVGAHLDAWDFGTGAQDNGSGAASVLEVARAIHALGRAPKRTIRFALWGGEEQGLLGSRAYVKAHASELDRTVVMLNTDFGTGSPKGWVADGRPDVVTRFEPLAKSVLGGLGAEALDTEAHCDTDHCPFWLAGVPTLNLDVDGTHYFEIHHQASDTLEKVSPSALASGAAVVAVTALVLADTTERIAPRLDHATVVVHAKEAKLFDSLVFEGILRQ